jgi:hypothetical protein
LGEEESGGGPFSSAMQHPVQAHIESLELLMVELCFRHSREVDSILRMHLSDRIQSLGWVLKCYRNGLQVEEQLVARK